jgi:hypothetical protein
VFGVEEGSVEFICLSVKLGFDLHGQRILQLLLESRLHVVVNVVDIILIVIVIVVVIV